MEPGDALDDGEAKASTPALTAAGGILPNEPAAQLANHMGWDALPLIRHGKHRRISLAQR